MASITLQSFRNLFDYNAKTGAFATSVKGTRGTISLSQSGELLNVNRRWYQHQKAPVGSAAPIVVREQLIAALANDGLDTGSDLMKSIRRRLGLSENNADENIAHKPLERMVVKQILEEYDTSKAIDQCIKEFHTVDREKVVQNMIADKELCRVDGVEMPVCNSEKEQRFEFYTRKTAAAIMQQWPNGMATQRERFKELFGTKPTFDKVLTIVRRKTADKIAAEPKFAKLFSGEISEDSKNRIAEEVNRNYDKCFELLTLRRQTSNGNLETGIASDFIRSADGGASMTGSTINDEPVQVPEDGMVNVTEENKSELQQQLGPDPRDRGANGGLNFSGMMSSKDNAGIYGTFGGSFAHQIMTRLPNHGLYHKRLMLYFTAQLSMSGPMGFWSGDDTISNDYGIGTLSDSETFACVKNMNGGQEGPRKVAIKIDKEEVVLKQTFVYGPAFGQFENAGLDIAMPLLSITTEMRIPLQDAEGNPINTDSQLAIKAKPKGVKVFTTVKSVFDAFRGD